MGLRARIADGAIGGDGLERRPPAGTAARRAAGGFWPSALTGRRHGTRSAANGVCPSHVRITPNAGIPAEKGPPRNWGSFPPPAFGGLCRPEAGVPVRPSPPCTFGVPRPRLFMPGGVCRRTDHEGFSRWGAFRPASRGSAKPAPTTLRYANVRAAPFLSRRVKLRKRTRSRGFLPVGASALTSLGPGSLRYLASNRLAWRRWSSSRSSPSSSTTATPRVSASSIA